MSSLDAKQKYLDNLRGVRQRDAIRTSERVRDTRNRFERLVDDYKDYGKIRFKKLFNFFVVLSIGLPFLITIIFPVFCIALLIAIHMGRKVYTPFSTVPVMEGIFNEKKQNFELPPGLGTNLSDDEIKPNGIIFFAEDMESGGEFWVSNERARRHIIIFGTTGSGKTEMLLSFCFGALLCGSGFSFVDAKGTYALYFQVYTMARMFGREDDVLLISYLTGIHDVRARFTSAKISNTMSLIAGDNHDQMTQKLGSLIPQAGGDNRIWTELALSMLEAQTAVQVYDRDVKKIPASLKGINKMMEFKVMFDIWKKAKAVEGDTEHADYYPEWIVDSLGNFLTKLTGFNADAEEQSADVYKYFSFSSMQFAKILGSLTGLYGYIFNTDFGEVNFEDVLLNRRIVVVLLPSLAKSATELQQIGNMLITTNKNVFSRLSGDSPEGFMRDLNNYMPTKSTMPFFSIWDEWGQIAINGASVMPAQARALGVSCIFAGQDIYKFKENAPQDAEAIIANSGIQIGGKLNEAKDTYQVFASKIGSVTVRQSTGSEYVDNVAQENRTINYETKSFSEYADFEAQKPGMAHFLSDGQFIRGLTLYTNIQLGDSYEVKVNQFLRLPPPNKERIDTIKETLLNAETRIVNIKNEANADNRQMNINQHQKEIKSGFEYFKEQLMGGNLTEGEIAQRAACALVARLSNDYLHNVQKRVKDARMEAKNKQIQFFKPDEIIAEAYKQYEESTKDIRLNIIASTPYGMPQNRSKEALVYVQATVQGSVNQAESNIENMQTSINSKLYPQNTLPAKGASEMYTIIKSTHENFRIGKGSVLQSNNTRQKVIS